MGLRKPSPEHLLKLMVKYRCLRLKVEGIELELSPMALAPRIAFPSQGFLPFRCERCGLETSQTPKEQPLHMLTNGKVCGRIVQNFSPDKQPTSDEDARMPLDESMLMW